jgi:hypothetical protein
MMLVNEELRALLVADQTDRADGHYGSDAALRDDVRVKQVRAILASGVQEDPEDLFAAAMILQHGSSQDDYWMAHELAKASAGAGYSPARWLAAAAYDRWLMHQGKPQRYGTQYLGTGDGARRLWEVDPATTDEERSQWGVPPLAEALNRADGRIQPASTIRFHR